MIEVRNYKQEHPNGEPPEEKDEDGHYLDPQLEELDNMTDELFEKKLTENW